MKKVVLFVSLLAIASPAAAADWRVIALAGDKPTRDLWFIDAETMKVTGSKMRAWLQIVFEQPDPKTGGTRSVQLSEFDCEERTTRTLSWTLFKGDTSISSNDGRPVRYALPGSAIEGAIKRACAGDIGSQSYPEPSEAAAMLWRALAAE